MNTPARRVVIAVTFALAMSLLALAAVAISFIAGRAYDPLGEYPVQRVDSQLAGWDSPSVHSSADEVTVTGTKCAIEETRVRGSTSWVELSPGGEVVTLATATAVRARGCVTRTYRNDLPPSVVARIVHLADRGVTESEWQIVGVETPISPEGSEGLPRPWQTQNFTIVYDEEPT